MTTEIQTFKEYLAFYGADLDTWPQHARAFGQRLLSLPEYQSLLDAEHRFEQLLNERLMPIASSDFAIRIARNARVQAKARSSAAKLFGIWENAPSAAIAAMLLLGFAVGLGALAPVTIIDTASSTQGYSDDEGAML